MKITQDKKNLNDLRKWATKEKRRYRLSSTPKFSFGLDSKTKNIVVYYSIYKVVGFDIETDEAKTKLTRKVKWTGVSHRDFQDLNIRHIYNQVVKDVEKTTKEVIKEDVNLPTWIKKYSTEKVRNGKELSSRTLYSDKQVLGYYLEWLEVNEPKYLDIHKHKEDGDKILEKYLNNKMNTKTRYGTLPKKNSIANSYRRIKSFFNWIHFQDDTFPFNMLRMKGYGITRNELEIPIATSIEDMKVLIKWMDENIENKYERHFIPILRMLLITGCRISEVVEMKIENIDLTKKIYKLFSKGKWRTIKLDSETLWRDLDYWIFKNGKARTDKEYVFHLEYWRRGNKNGLGGGVKMNLKKHISSTGVSHKFKKVIKSLGLNEKLTPHSCRRGFISYMLEKSGGDIPLVASIVGHSTYDMVSHYERRRPSEERTTIDLGEVLSNE